MKKIILPLLLLISCTAFSQSLKKYPVSKSGCSYYNYCDAKFDASKSQDSSDIYTIPPISTPGNVRCPMLPMVSFV